MSGLPPDDKQPRSVSKALRDVAIFVGGAVGFVHEVFFTTADRPFILILSASMMGLPAAIRLDEFRRTGK